MGNERKNIMKRRIHDALLGIVGLCGVAFFALSGASCEKPTMQCAVGHGPFIVKYAATTGDATCYPGGTYEEIGFSTYLQSKPKSETITKAEDGEDIKTVTSTGADYNTRKIAVQSSVLGGLYQERNGAGSDAADKAFAFGDYTGLPDEGDLCYAGGGAVGALSVADLNIDADGMDPAIHFTQTWSDVRFFVTTGVPGTQVVGNMKFENATAGCQVEYKFTGLYPAVFCGNAVFGHRDDDGDTATAMDNDTDDDGDPMTPVANDKDDDGDDATPVADDDGKAGPDVDVDDEVVLSYDADDANCDPKADPAAGRVFGSGINPDFTTFCHPELLHCMLKAGTELVK
jgi:hypothetical protein